MTSVHGTPRDTVEKALLALDEAPLSLLARSPLYRTPFVPAGEGADVVNAVCQVETELAAAALLDHLHAIEARFARARATRWADRTLDLDLLSIGDRVLPDRESVAHWISLPPERQKREAPEGLILPHPRMQDRAFVLVPAAEILPGWVHPLTGLTMREMRDALPAGELAEIKLLR